MKRNFYSTNRVYTVGCKSYDYEPLKKCIYFLIDSILDECKIDSLFGKNVVVKPNLLAKRSPSSCVTTNPEIVRAACEYFMEKGAICVIADSPGGIYNPVSQNPVYRVCKMDYAAESTGASLNMDFSYKHLKFKDGKAAQSFNIITPLASADLIVNLCRLKTHSLALMSNAVKNMFGSIPGLQKAEQHARFPKKDDFAAYLVDLCLLNCPTVNISDAIIAMEGNGPAGGKLKKVGLLSASANPFALDIAASEIMGVKPREVPFLKNAISRGLCPDSADKLCIIGEPLSDYSCKFVLPDSNVKSLVMQLPSLFDGKLQKWIEPRPQVNTQKCVGCGECARCCPKNTIKITGRKAHIDYSNCIKCYCCQELCPKKAIDIKRRIFFNF